MRVNCSARDGPCVWGSWRSQGDCEILRISGNLDKDASGAYLL